MDVRFAIELQQNAIEGRRRPLLLRIISAHEIHAATSRRVINQTRALRVRLKQI